MPRAEFAVHMLNETGKQNAIRLAEHFERCLDGAEAITGTTGREVAIVRTKMEEACFFAKKAMAVRPENQLDLQKA